MLLDDKQKNSKIKALESILESIEGMDTGKLKSKKPVMAEMSVTAIKPENGEGEDENEEGELEEYMKEAGHEGVEQAEGKLFPQDEAREEASTIDPKTKAMIKELYNRFVK